MAVAGMMVAMVVVGMVRVGRHRVRELSFGLMDRCNIITFSELSRPAGTQPGHDWRIAKAALPCPLCRLDT
jgi:hypothetical protein